MTLIFGPDNHQAVFRLESTNFKLGYALTALGVDGGGVTQNDIAVALAGSWIDNLTALQRSDVTLTEVNVFNATTSALATTDSTGAVAQAPADPQVSLLINKRTPTRGPRAKGRMYPPGLVYEGTYDASGNMSLGDVANYQDAFDAFFTDITLATITPVILQNEEGTSAPLDPPPVITRLQVDRMAATQRRRLR